MAPQAAITDSGLSEAEAIDALTERTKKLISVDLSPPAEPGAPSAAQQAAQASAVNDKLKVADDTLRSTAAKVLVHEEQAQVDAAQHALVDAQGTPPGSTLPVHVTPPPAPATSPPAPAPAPAPAPVDPALQAAKALAPAAAALSKVDPTEAETPTNPSDRARPPLTLGKKSILALQTCEAKCDQTHTADASACSQRCISTDYKCREHCVRSHSKCRCECDDQQRWSCEDDDSACHCWRFQGEMNGHVESLMMQAENAALAAGLSPAEAKQKALEAEKEALDVTVGSTSMSSAEVELADVHRWMQGLP